MDGLGPGGHRRPRVATVAAVAQLRQGYRERTPEQVKRLLDDELDEAVAARLCGELLRSLLTREGPRVVGVRLRWS